MIPGEIVSIPGPTPSKQFLNSGEGAIDQALVPNATENTESGYAADRFGRFTSENSNYFDIFGEDLDGSGELELVDASFSLLGEGWETSFLVMAPGPIGAVQNVFVRSFYSDGTMESDTVSLDLDIRVLPNATAREKEEECQDICHWPGVEWIQSLH